MEQPGANVIEDEVANIEKEVADIETDECNEDISQLSDFQSNSHKYTLIMWDLETTGTSAQQIVQIGAWEMFSNYTFQSLVKPGKFK